MRDPACFRSGPALGTALRNAARDALPEGAFLRIDRGDGLFAAGRAQGLPEEDWTGRLAAAGFAAAPAGHILRVSPGASWLEALAAAWPAPPDFLCDTLKRFSGTPDAQSLTLFALGVKGLYQTPDPAFERRLRQRAAVCLRSEGGGGLYACGLLLYLLNETWRPTFPREETR